MRRVLFCLIQLVVISSLLLSLQACGSRGGSSSSGSTTDTSGTTDTTTDGGTTTTSTPVASIQLSASPAAINPLESSTVTVILLNSTGQPVTTAKEIVFSLSAPELGTINPSATTSSGTVKQTFTAKNIEGIVTITASVDGKTASQDIQISTLVAASTVEVSANPASITNGGTSVVSASVFDGENNPMPNGTTVNFIVDNSALGTVVAAATTTDGVAKATFSAGITSTGTVTVTATSGVATGTTAIEVTGTSAGSIEFVSASPQIISIKGSGGLETSEITFRVKDSSGNLIVSSQSVSLELSGPNGGEYLGDTPGTTSVTVGTVNGEVSAILHSGTIPGTATIIATVLDGANQPTTLSTSSGVIAIGGGIPSEGHFSLSTTALNLEGLRYDGITADITALIADRYGNFNVLEGTSVSFYSECGAIDRAVNLNAEGAGSIKFRTQRPHPQDVSPSIYDDLIAAIYQEKLGVTIPSDQNPSDGLCTIVSVVDGEEEFTDANANGAYDVGETFVDTYDDVHLDKDDDSEWLSFGTETPGNPYDPTFEDLIVDRDLDGIFDGMNNVWDYNKRISQQIKLLFTGDPTISVAKDGTPAIPVLQGDMITVADGGSQKLNFSLHDVNFNPPISGTSFSVSVNVGEISGSKQHTFLDTNGIGAPIFSVTVVDTSPGDTDPPEVGTLEFTWSWKGGEYTYSTPLSID